MKPLLETRGLSKTFGGLKAVQNVALTVGENRIVSVIGPNGAGKTTFFNCLSGIYRPDGGEILLDGRNIAGKPPHLVCRRGMARTFQNIRLFPEMTVLENVLVGQFRHRSLSPLPLLLRPCAASAARKPPTTPRRSNSSTSSASPATPTPSPATSPTASSAAWKSRARSPPAAPAAARRARRRHEPAGGRRDGAAHLRIRERGLAILLIEHHMKVVMTISDEILVLDHGIPIAHGAPDRVRQDPQVIKAYLGEEAAH
ncbi:MAG: ATP-binding cassette domain-containing protein [Verrucomicrobiota bacterium]